MKKRVRLPLDRRSGEDRRKAYKLGYFLEGGVERRSGKERRSEVERRKDWLRVSEWASIWKGIFEIRKFLDS